MELDTQQIWKDLGDELFFFILKRVKNEEAAMEILQNSFLKIHKNLPNLREKSKARPWTYQIIRNEIVNFHKGNSKTEELRELKSEIPEFGINSDTYCCFEKFIRNLPEKYHSVIEEVYLKGNSQSEAAENLGISLSNTKARIRRAKDILKMNFQECCNYQLDSHGLLTGEPDCGSCA